MHFPWLNTIRITFSSTFGTILLASLLVVFSGQANAFGHWNNQDGKNQKKMQQDRNSKKREGSKSQKSGQQSGQTKPQESHQKKQQPADNQTNSRNGKQDHDWQKQEAKSSKKSGQERSQKQPPASSQKQTERAGSQTSSGKGQPDSNLKKREGANSQNSEPTRQGNPQESRQKRPANENIQKRADNSKQELPREGSSRKTNKEQSNGSARDSFKSPGSSDVSRRKDETRSASLEKAAREESLVVTGVVSKDQLARYGDDPVKLELLEQVYNQAARLGVDNPQKVREYQNSVVAGGKEAIEEVRRKMVVDGLGLPGEALQYGHSAEELLGIVGTIDLLGGSGLVDLKSGELWGQIGANGPDSVYRDILIKGNGLPTKGLGDLAPGAILEGMGSIGVLGGNTGDAANWDLFAAMQAGKISVGDFTAGVANNSTGGGAGGGSHNRPDGSPDTGIPGTGGGTGSGSSSGSGPPAGGASGPVTPPATSSSGGDRSGGDRGSSNSGGDSSGTGGTSGNISGTSSGDDGNSSSNGSAHSDTNGGIGQTGGANGEGSSSGDVTIVSKESYNIGGATWVTTVFSTGDYVMNLVDNKTGEVIKTQEGKVQTLEESDTDTSSDSDSSSGDTETPEAEGEPDEYTPGPDGEGGLTPAEQLALVQKLGLGESLTDYIGRKLAVVIFDTNTGSGDSTPNPNGESNSGAVFGGGIGSVVDPGDPETTIAAPGVLTVEQRKAMIEGEIGGGVTDPNDN